jgi:hypothetical protein
LTLLSSTIGPPQYQLPAGTTTRPPPAALAAMIALLNAVHESKAVPVKLDDAINSEPGLVGDELWLSQGIAGLHADAAVTCEVIG